MRAHSWKNNFVLLVKSASAVSVDVASIIQMRCILKAVTDQNIYASCIKEIAHRAIHRRMPGEFQPTLLLISVFAAQINVNVFAALLTIHDVVQDNDLIMICISVRSSGQNMCAISSSDGCNYFCRPI